MAARTHSLSGFTLFFHHGKGWQMSVRRENEPGWSISHISEEQAAVILSMLETSGHPDGPWSVVVPTDENGWEVLPAADLSTELFIAAEVRARLTETFDELA